MASRITAAGAVQAGTFNICAYRIPVDGAHFAITLKLPSNRNVVVLAVNETLAPQVTFNNLSGAASIYGLATAGHPATSAGLDEKDMLMIGH